MAPISRTEATNLLLNYVFAGALGSPAGKGVVYSLVDENNLEYSFVAALADESSTGRPIDRFCINVKRETKEIHGPILISLSESELGDAIFSATGYHLKTYSRFSDGDLSISYKISVTENPTAQYVLQLRFHGDVTSMNLFMQFVSSTVSPEILPLPEFILFLANNNGKGLLDGADRSHSSSLV